MIDLLIPAAWLLGGTISGAVYFRMVRHSADLMLSGGSRGPTLGVFLMISRMAGLGAALVFASMQGPWPLLAAALGVLIGRTVEMRGAGGKA